MKAKTWILSTLLITLIVCALSRQTVLTQGSGPPDQPASLIYDEMRTVYLGNLARRDNGVPPLRWNAQMTDAARWFSWDSVENRTDGYCGHQDTLGRWPSERVPAFGYKGYCGAENCYCGYMTPEAAIEGWMNSPGHRANLLDPNTRELGMGHYRRESDGRGYLTQDFGHDPVYPPVVIEHESIATTSSTVNLYIYDREGGGGFAGLGPATEMMVANDACFTGSSWEPYAAEKTWTLEPDTGWRTVYVKTRDAVSRTTVVSDTIYLGQSVPLDELGLHLASSTTDQVTLYGLDGGSLPYVQFSQNWFADDTFDTFHLWWGYGEQVNDPAALGDTAFRLRPGDGESFAWVWATEFFQDTPFVAYLRLKVDDNTSSSEVARVSVNGGGTEYGPLSLKGTDFTAANTYQEFPIAFTFHDNPDDVFLIFNFWRSGQADVYVDGVYIFTDPQPVQSPLTWTVPGGNYRGGGIWLRYTDDAGTFSLIEEADLNPERLSVSPTSLLFLAEYGAPSPASRTLTVRREGCEPFTWDTYDDAAWLQVQAVGETVQASVDTAGLITGTYHATITVEAEAGVLGSPAQMPVTLILADHLYFTYLPLTLRVYGP
ncbi:MAG: CAP domain-containing protein [Chloroflexi bacterium]|nr:CAP domain-containing protein [Chloroflexota bacterium]